MVNKLLKLSVVFLLQAGCGEIFGRKSTSADTNKLAELANRSALYTQLLSTHQDAHGFILTEHCDALLFTGLLSAARPDLSIAIRAAQSSNLAWHRRPNQDCGPSFGNSRSTVSRDMMLGLYWHLWKTKDLELAVELMDFLKSNLYYMPGEGSAGELFMTPPYMRTLADMIRALGGPAYKTELLFPVTYSEDSGFIAHLVTWHIALRGDILGEITNTERNLLKEHRDREPKNPLFQAAYQRYSDGNQDVAISLLLDQSHWPADRLPTTTEHCDEWPIQREYKEKDWGPCPAQNKEHTGAELVAVYELLIKES